ncbi:hypothetical protein ABPG77_009203 [Micractinium sp. CCAP 211/92]
MGLHSSHPGLQQDVPASLKDIDDALYSAIKTVFSHFLAGRFARFVRGKSIAQRLQQADDAIEDSEEEFHKTLQLLSMERLLRLAAAKGQPAEPDAARLMQPTWAEFQLPSLPQQVDARDREAQAAGALANLALGSPARQREIVAAGGVAPLTTLLARSTDSVAEAAQRAAAAALCNVAASSLPAEEADSAGEQLALLIQHSSDERARQAAADALRNLTFFAAKRTAATAATDGAAAQQEQTAAQTAAGGRPQAAAVAMNLAIGAGDSVQGGGDAAQAGPVQPAPATPAAAPQLARIQPLIELLRGSDSPAAQSAAAAALANIAATSGDLRTAIGSKAIPRLVELLGSGSPDVQQAAATALLNCAAGSPANQTAIRAEGGVEALEQLPGASYSPGVQDVATALLSTLSASSLADASRGAAGVGQLPAPDSGDEAGGVRQLPAPDSGDQAAGVGQLPAPDSGDEAAGVGQLPAPDSGDEAAGVGQLPAPDSDT